MNGSVKLTWMAVILALGMVLSASVVSKFFVRVRQEKAITVKGYAEKDVVSDVGKFYCVCSARGTSLKEAYDRLQESRNAVMDYLKKKEFRAEEVIPETIKTTKIPRKDAEGKETNQIEYFDVSQTIMISSRNVALIRDAAISITDLIKEGIDISASAPAFLISDLKGIKLGLLASATEDGYLRAVALANNSKGKIGALISAQQGVFQITERNSTDISGYGEYDTSTIEKTAKAIVTLEYAIDSNK